MRQPAGVFLSLANKFFMFGMCLSFHCFPKPLYGVERLCHLWSQVTELFRSLSGVRACQGPRTALELKHLDNHVEHAAKSCSWLWQLSTSVFGKALAGACQTASASNLSSLSSFHKSHNLARCFLVSEAPALPCLACHKQMFFAAASSTSLWARTLLRLVRWSLLDQAVILLGSHMSTLPQLGTRRRWMSHSIRMVAMTSPAWHSSRQTTQATLQR